MVVGHRRSTVQTRFRGVQRRWGLCFSSQPFQLALPTALDLPQKLRGAFLLVVGRRSLLNLQIKARARVTSRHVASAKTRKRSFALMMCRCDRNHCDEHFGSYLCLHQRFNGRIDVCETASVKSHRRHGTPSLTLQRGGRRRLRRRRTCHESGRAGSINSTRATRTTTQEQANTHQPVRKRRSQSASAACAATVPPKTNVHHRISTTNTCSRATIHSLVQLATLTCAKRLRAGGSLPAPVRR